jgi:hypothetical protein
VKYARAVIEVGTEDINLEAFDSASIDSCTEAELEIFPDDAVERKSSIILLTP